MSTEDEADENEDPEYSGFSEEEGPEEPDPPESESDRYPKFRIVYQTTNYHLPQINDLLSKGNIINIRPEYQRRLRWDNRKKSALIESFLLNIPIPPVFFYESDYAQYEVMDGQQRLNCVREFYENGFKLQNLKQLPELNGSQYKDLDERIRRTLDRASVSSIVLLAESADGKKQSSTIRKEVFERLNTGGQKLNPQEIRNAIYPGLFNETIIALTRTEEFTAVWGIPSYTKSNKGDYYDNPKRQKNALYKTMGDCQIVLRFFALLDPSKIRGSMQRILNTCAKESMALSKEACDELATLYSECLTAAVQIRGENPFDLGSSTRKAKRSVPFQDALMCSLGRLSKADRGKLVKESAATAEAIEALITDQKNYDLLVGRANTSEDTKLRIEALSNVLKNNLK